MDSMMWNYEPHFEGKNWKCFILILLFYFPLCEDVRVNATRLWSDISVILFRDTMCHYYVRSKSQNDDLCWKESYIFRWVSTASSFIWKCSLYSYWTCLLWSKNYISSALRPISKDAVFLEDHVAVLVFLISLSKGNFASRSDKHY